jgi:hypothetical protein
MSTPLQRLLQVGLLLAFCLLPYSALAQSDAPADSAKWHVEVGSGYYTQEGTDAGGAGLFVDVGRRLNTGFVGSFGFGIAQTYHRYNPRTPIFGNDRYYRTHFIFRLSFDYPFTLTDRQNLSLGTGILYVKRYYTVPGVAIRPDPDGDGVLVSGGSQPTTPGVVGLHFSAKYSYRFSRVSLGLRADAHLFQFERGGEYILAPFLQVHF